MITTSVQLSALAGVSKRYISSKDGSNLSHADKPSNHADIDLTYFPKLAISRFQNRQIVGIALKSVTRIKTTLTKINQAAILNAPRNIEGGRGNPFRLGDKTPIIKSVFLRPSFLAWRNFALCKFIMAGLFGQSLWLVAPSRGITTPFNPAANTVVSISGGYSTLRLGIHQ